MASPVTRPPFLEIGTVIGCAVDCCFCPQQKSLDNYAGPRLMPFETFAACIAKLPPDAELSFAGFAEPWLNNRCTDMAEEARRQGRQWEAYTTCVGMTEADVDRIAAAGPIRVKLHLADVEGYAKIRVDRDYVRVVTRLADALGERCSWMSMGTLPPALWARFGKVKPSHMHSRAGNVAASDRVRLVVRKRGPLRCRPGPKLDRNILLPDASVVSCCFDFSIRHVFGNLLTQTWEEIRNGAPLAQFRAAMAGENDDVLCRTCEMAEPCG